jgi:sigma54-dependent transcription regulator
LSRAGLGDWDFRVLEVLLHKGPLPVTTIGSKVWLTPGSEREFKRLGCTRTHRVDVRLVAATNRDLLETVKRGEFRSDLYCRLNVFPVRLPPLRARLEDIPAL